jgi:hypothetical protein
MIAAARLPALNEPANNQLLLPIAMGLMVFSIKLLSMGNCASSMYLTNASHLLME